MSGGLFDYIQNQTLTEPQELPSEPRKRTPLEIAQAEQQDAVEQARAVYRAYQENILKAGTLRSEILKGLYQGESTDCQRHAHDRIWRSSATAGCFGSSRSRGAETA